MMLTEMELFKWTSEHSTYGEMIFQMLSRGTYTHRQVAQYIGCPIEAVTRVAEKRERAIKKNHRDYLKVQKVYMVVLASPAITGYPARPSSCAKDFIRYVRLFDGSVFGRGHCSRDMRSGDWC